MERLFKYRASKNQGIGLGEYVADSESQLPCDGKQVCDDCDNCLGIRSRATHIINHCGYERYACPKHAHQFQESIKSTKMNQSLKSLISFCMTFDEIRTLDQTKPIGLVPFSKQECLQIFKMNSKLYAKSIKNLKIQNEPFICDIHIDPIQSRAFYMIENWTQSEKDLQQKYPKQVLCEYKKDGKMLTRFFDYRNSELIFEMMLNIPTTT